MAYRKPVLPRQQITLWAQRLDDAVGPDDPVRMAEALFNTEPFVQAFGELERAQQQTEGQPGYSPAMLAKLVVYGQLSCIRSSRRLEQACYHRLDVMWLVEGQRPDHVTIARFVQRHVKRMKDLLKASIRAATEMGMVTLELVAIDGTFIEANAGRKSVKKKREIKDELAAVDAVIEKITAEYDRNDAIEGAAAAQDLLGMPDQTLPEEQRLARFKAKQARLQEAIKTIEIRESAPRRSDLPSPNEIASVTDPQCRHMRDKEHRTKPNYNAQLGVDAEAGMVVAVKVTDQPNDSGQMLPMLQAVESNCGALPKRATFDAGYHTSRDVAAVQSMASEVFVTDPKLASYRKAEEARAILASGGTLSLQQIEQLPRDSEGRFESTCFVYFKESDTYRCPAGQTLSRSRDRTRNDRHGPMRGAEYVTAACSNCQFASSCSRSKTGRRVTRAEFDDMREVMLRRTQGAEGKAVAVQRASTVEPRIGEIKQNWGIRKFMRRGIEKVQAEFELLGTALNLGRLIRRMTTVPAGG